MSIAIAHFAVGFGSTMIIWVVLNTNTHERYKMPALVGGGIWAIMPDLWHILPIYSDVYLSEVHHSFIANIFWFHRVFDLVDTKDSLYFATLALMYLCACTIIHEIVLRKTDDL